MYADTYRRAQEGQWIVDPSFLRLARRPGAPLHKLNECTSILVGFILF